MAKLHMLDGNIKEVSEEQAKAIYAVLMGTDKPQNATQAAFCETVSNVTFDEVKLPREPVKGKGYEAFRKVGEGLKSRLPD